MYFVDMFSTCRNRNPVDDFFKQCNHIVPFNKVLIVEIRKSAQQSQQATYEHIFIVAITFKFSSRRWADGIG